MQVVENLMEVEQTHTSTYTSTEHTDEKKCLNVLLDGKTHVDETDCKELFFPSA